MNCFIWILLLLGCGGNCSNRNNCCCENTNCCRENRCNCNRGENLIQPRETEECCIKHHHHDHECMTPPPVPRYVVQEDDCGCNN